MTTPAGTGTAAGVGGRLRRAGLGRAALPVLLPVSALLSAVPTPEPLDRRLDDLLAAVRRHVRYRRTAAVVEWLGIAVAWLGVMAPGGRAVTLTGVAVAAGGAVLRLTGKDRLRSVEATITDLYRRHRAGLAEWLAVVLEAGPYSYSATAGSGRLKVDCLRARSAALPPGVVDDLADAVTAPQVTAPAECWARLRAQVTDLVRVDEEAHTAQRRAESAVDRLYVGLLVLLVAVAAASASVGLPGAALATAASLAALGVRAADDVATAAFPAGATGAGTPAGVGAAWRDVRERDHTTCSVADLQALTSAWVLVSPRPIGHTA